MSNTINTRIRVKYDTLSAWQSSTFYPLAGEICVAVIPNSSNNYNIGNPDASGLSPYAIGMKVGDGAHRFSDLPWIQAIAGDVYSWAKNSTPPAANTIAATYGVNNEPQTVNTVQDAIDKINASLGGLVAGNISPESLGAALAQLTEQLAGASGVLFDSNYTIPEDENEQPQAIPTKLVRKITQNGLTFTVDSSALVAADIPDLSVAKITDLVFNSSNGAYNAVTNKAATMADITHATSGLTGAMHFKGEISGASLPEATDTSTFNTYDSGDVVLFDGSEYVYNKGNTAAGSTWIHLGDEGSFLISGSVTANDLEPTFKAAIETALQNLGEANVIEQITVNNVAQTVTNKSVNITVPTGALANKDSVSSSDLDSALSILVNQGIEVSDNNSNYTALTPNSTSHNYRLSKIANTGSIYDVIEGNANYLIFYCGTASDVINT